ncbi:MAG TPA: hypothetical protein VIU64_05560 [Polyangia bacterium]
MTEHRLPEPSSTWEIGPGGTVSLVGGVGRGRPFTGKQRAASTCGACGATGHSRRSKKCPKAAP